MEYSNIEELFHDKGFAEGRMISPSKSLYRKRFPDNEVIFNANIVLRSTGKVWHGDLDITKSLDELKQIAAELGEPMYILREMDCRFDNETDSIDLLISRSAKTIEHE
jgi:hypothetical protein